MRDNAKAGALTEVTFFILLSLYEPRHGYAIMQFVEEQTGGRLILGAGSLYGALNNLTKKGLIAPLGEDTERKKQYRITLAGRRIVEGELARLREVTQTAADIVEAHRLETVAITGAHPMEAAAVAGAHPMKAEAEVEATAAKASARPGWEAVSV